MGSSLSTLQEVSRRFDAEDLTFLAHHPYMHYTVHNKALFTHHIFSRVKRQNPDRHIECEAKGAIVIHGDAFDDEKLYLYPCWDMIGTNVQHDACEAVTLAIAQLDAKACQHIYLLFPKTEHFQKHISIKIPHLEEAGAVYTLKLIPYKIH